MKHHHKGFTVIEAMIVIVIVGIVAALVFPATQKEGTQFLWQEPTRCIGGYTFTAEGQQVINQQGGGVPCTK